MFLISMYNTCPECSKFLLFDNALNVKAELEF